MRYKRAGSWKVGWVGLGFLLGSGVLPLASGAGWTERFDRNPLTAGWHVYGDSSLFAWDSQRHIMAVTWDSSRSNSYFHRPLGTVLTKADDFEIRFTFSVEEVESGVNPEKPYTFELALGLLNLKDATSSNFFRGAGINRTYGPKNLVELDYFPDSGFGATVAPTLVSTNNRIVFSDNHPLELVPEAIYEVVLSYEADDRVLHTRIWEDGKPFEVLPGQGLRELALDEFPDFRVDTFAVASYSDEHQSPPEFAGSLFARGALRSVEVTVPDPPLGKAAGSMINDTWQVVFRGDTNWFYALERSLDFVHWQIVGSVPGREGPVLRIEDPDPVQGAQFYRVRAERP